MFNKTLFFSILLTSLSSVVLTETLTPLVEVEKSIEMNVIKEIPLTGTVTSPRSADLSPEVSGLVKMILYEEGLHVQKGDVLLKLDQDLEKLKLDAATAKTRQIKLELEDAKRRLTDAKQLEKKKQISANDVKSLLAEVNIKTAELQLTQIEQQQQKLRLEQHHVLAPFDGVISQKNTETGEWISPGDTIAKLISIDSLRIDFQVPQSAFAKTKPTTPMRIKLDVLPEKIFNGKITTIVPVTKVDARTFKIHVIIEANELSMIPGMSANGVLLLNTENKATVVSRDAIIRHPDGRTTVWVINQNKTVSEQVVKTGLGFNGKIVIEEGLIPNAAVVVKGNESLREGQIVSIHQS